MNKGLILIVDDEQRLVRSMQMVLEAEGYSVAMAYTGQDGINKVLELDPELLLLDLRLPDLSGLEVLKQLRQMHKTTPVIMLSAHGDIKVAVDAVKSGAYDFISKPFDINELKILISRCLERQRLDSEVNYYREKELNSSLIGQSEGMVKMQDQIGRVAASSAKTILLQGESGTGKTAIAREIHNLSELSAGPFIEVNCASLPEQLLEAELFGAEKGAYTGADKKRAGLVELASDGTLFLDEIGEVDLSIQAKLLTFLESHSYRPVGGGREHKANVRVIAATNLDLEQAVQEGQFRSDLYYRLNVMPIAIPSLQQRDQDIPLLLEHFALTMAANEGVKPVLMTDPVRARLQSYAWPGNIRELKNLMERLTILYPGEEIELDMLPPEMRASDSGDLPVAVAAEEITIEDQLANKERSIILQALSDVGGRKGLAAEKLGISRHAFKRRLQKLGID
ncbi:sigma-54-dependent transcriptional regulator [Neptuniibacter halophilus]|uniref:sigma-54-dependent transcriptional regulator n=1 Tax=Neptuniibacter halophilus TaxID=651666 RepID=UPI0025734825|nr:sigma-54 dependent transcriptional regulator [Neptuniibacter halophilus]